MMMMKKAETNLEDGFDGQGSVAFSDFPSMVPSAVGGGDSDYPSMVPSDVPSMAPSTDFDGEGTVGSSDYPSFVPSDTPSTFPSTAPSIKFLVSGTSNSPSDAPSMVPSDAPSTIPSDAPSAVPSIYSATTIALGKKSGGGGMMRNMMMMRYSLITATGGVSGGGTMMKRGMMMREQRKRRIIVEEELPSLHRILPEVVEEYRVLRDRQSFSTEAEAISTSSFSLGTDQE
jgi:hypothetical protein